MPNANIRSLLFLVFLLSCPLNAQNRSTDSLRLWNQLHTLGERFQHGQTDSALTYAQQLLPTAIGQQDQMAQLNLYLIIGLCFRTQQNEKAALSAFMSGADICERTDFQHKADEDAIHVATAIMTNLALTEFELRKTNASNRHARSSITWAMRSSNHQLHAINLTHAGGVLANNCESDDAMLQALEEGRRDADSLGLNTYAVLAATYLMTARAERTRMERESLSNPNSLAASPPPPVTQAFPSSSTTRPSATNSPSDTPETIPSPTQNDRQQRVISLSSLLLGILAMLFLSYILWQRRLKHRRDHMIGRLREASKQRYLEGKEEERNRLAKEMHDGVSNQLLAVQMKLQAEGLTPQTMQMLSESREQVRRMSHGLMPPAFVHTTLNEALRHYVNELNGANGCELSYRSEPADVDLKSLPLETALGIYRIVQEAVSNILKHADATTIAVVLQQKEDAITTTIADDGTQPFPDEKDSNGIGLRTMQERADAIGAHISISILGSAHLLTLHVPNRQ